MLTPVATKPRRCPGRDPEQRQLTSLLDEVGERGQALVLRGEPGGARKIRLLSEAARQARERGTTVLSAAGVRSEARLPSPGWISCLVDVLSSAQLDTRRWSRRERTSGVRPASGRGRGSWTPRLTCSPNGARARDAREITDAAEANVAAVSYHFGSLQSLCDAAIEHALERYLDAQQEAIARWSRAHARGDSGGLRAAHAQRAGRRRSDLAVMRIVARAGIDPPAGGSGWAPGSIGSGVTSCGHSRRTSRSQRARSDLPDPCAAGLLNWLALAPIGEELRGKTRKQAERRARPRPRRCLPRRQLGLTARRVRGK